MIIFRTKEGNNYKVYAIVYHHYDGYPDGVGSKLVNFLQSKKMVNGISDMYKQFNGFECMVAQYISKFKDNKAGYVYLYPISDDSKEADADFRYYVTWHEKDKLFTIGMNDYEEVPLNKYEETFMNYDESSD